MDPSSFIPSLDFVLGGVVVGLIVAGIRSYATRRRLYVVVPRLFEHSNLSESGKTAEITIRNRGTRVEEDIQIQLAHKRTYEILASTMPTVSIDSNGQLSIPRISKQDEVSLILNVEGGEFGPDQVTSVSSKETKGLVKATLQDAEELTLSQAAMVFGLIFVVMPVLGYAVGSTVGEQLWRELRPKVVKASPAETALTSTGWSDFQEFARSDYFAAYDGEWPISIEFPNRIEDLLEFKINFRNETEHRATFRASAASPYNPQSYQGYINSLEYDIMTFPEDEVSRTIQAYVPFESARKVVIFDFTLEVNEEIFRFEYEWRYSP